jgi:hypothetical protein
MKGNVSSKLVSLETIVPTYKLLYKRDIDLYEAVELAFWALKKLGNYHLKDKFARVTIKSFKAEAPCDMMMIHAVTDPSPLNYIYRFLDQRNFYGYLADGGVNEGDTMQSPDTVYTPPSPEVDLLGGIPLPNAQNYVSNYRGLFKDYIWEGNWLKFNQETGEVDVIYSGLYTDKNGWPMVDEMTIVACCRFIMYTNVSADMYSNKNVSQAALVMADKEMQKAFGQAIVTANVSANEWDKVFNVMTTHVRKQFGIQLMGL